jgi:hypothetical protein
MGYVRTKPPKKVKRQDKKSYQKRQERRVRARNEKALASPVTQTVAFNTVAYMGDLLRTFRKREHTLERKRNARKQKNGIFS